MASKSKTKGATWEREFANFLGELYGEKFVRVPNSGAFVGGANSVRKAGLDAGQIQSFKGDIMPPSSWIHFNCECKNYKEFPFHQLPSGTVAILEKWISQCCEAAEPNDFSFVVIKITRKGTYILAPQHPSINPGSHYFSYQSSNHGSWYLLDYKLFWNLNKEVVKSLSSVV